MTEAPELLPCPFCGNASKPKIFPFEGKPRVPGYVIRCDASGFSGPEKGCGAESGWGDTPGEAATAWNRRTASPPVGTVGTLDERMEAAGMIPLSKLLAGDTPLARWQAHTGIRTLAHFEEWLLRRHREFKTMRVEYDLAGKGEDDELYEWVLAHDGAFSEVVANFRAASLTVGTEPKTDERASPADWLKYLQVQTNDDGSIPADRLPGLSRSLAMAVEAAIERKAATPPQEPSRRIAWLIERKDTANFYQPHWYAEGATGWHWWTTVAHEAKQFTSKAEAEAFPAYQMISNDPTISVTEHVFIGDASPPPSGDRSVKALEVKLAEVEREHAAARQNFITMQQGANTLLRKLDEAKKALEPFGRNAGASSLAKVYAHLTRQDAQTARALSTEGASDHG